MNKTKLILLILLMSDLVWASVKLLKTVREETESKKILDEFIDQATQLLSNSSKAFTQPRLFREIRENDAMSPTNKEMLCRTRDGRYLPELLFAKDTCASCYLFEINKYKHHLHIDEPWLENRKIYSTDSAEYPIIILVNGTINSTEISPIDMTDEASFAAVQDVKIRSNWKACCEAAVQCCQFMLSVSTDTAFKTNKMSCPRTWDGWQCWPDAPADTKLFEDCPTYSYIHEIPTCQKLSTKSCTSAGTWYTRQGREWTDYSSCGELKSIRSRLAIHVVALIISVLTLGPALFIFCYYRQLRVHRISLHKQLFISLLLEATCSIFFRLLELFSINTIQKSPKWCVAINIFRKYARQTNYMWYLCEGFYLHKLLATAFAEQKSIAAFYFVGWVLPFIPVGIYSILRSLWYQSDHCWSIPVGNLEYLIQVPPLVAILINFIFLINIIRIFLGKVRARQDCEPSQFKMTVKAGLMVIPLFGLQYIVTIYRPAGRACSWLEVYHVINNVIDGSTGFLVSVIFCYTNSEVRSLVKRSVRNAITSQDEIVMHRRDHGAFRSRTLSTVQTILMEARRSSSITRQNNFQNTTVVFSNRNRQKDYRKESNETIEELSHETQHENYC